MVKVEHEISVEQSFKLLDGVWLPIPVLRTVALQMVLMKALITGRVHELLN